MDSEGQIAWSKLFDDIKDIKIPYLASFRETIGLFRQIAFCYDNNLFDASVVLSRAAVDGTFSISQAVALKSKLANS